MDNYNGNNIPNLMERERILIKQILFWYICIMLFMQCTIVFIKYKAHDIRYVKITAHRGSSLRAPENTISSIKCAIEDGADFSEIDVQQTKDGQVVLFHDTTLKRIFGINKRIGEMNLYDLKQLDSGRFFSDKFKGERIPTLEEAINATDNKIKLNIEIKILGHEKGLVEKVAEEIKKNKFEDKCVVSSFNYKALVKIKRINPRIKIGYITDSTENILRYNVDFYSVKYSRVNSDFVRLAHNLGRQVHVWTVDNPNDIKRLVDLKVDNIITNNSYKFVEDVKRKK